MKKVFSFNVIIIFMVLAFNSCVYYVDRPYADLIHTSQPSYSYGVNNEQYFTDRNNMNTIKFLILQIYNNRYFFYEGNTVVAVWIFQPNKTVIKRGKTIEGLVKVFYKPDMPAAEIVYKNNERDGVCRFYNENGKPMEIGQYKKGVRYGDWKRFNEQGVIEEEFVLDKEKITYKLKPKNYVKKTYSKDFAYLGTEHEFKKEIKQDLSTEDSNPGNDSKAFGVNPMESKIAVDKVIVNENNAAVKNDKKTIESPRAEATLIPVNKRNNNSNNRQVKVNKKVGIKVSDKNSTEILNDSNTASVIVPTEEVNDPKAQSQQGHKSNMAEKQKSQKISKNKNRQNEALNTETINSDIADEALPPDTTDTTGEAQANNEKAQKEKHIQDKKDLKNNQDNQDDNKPNMENNR
ncbi:MAG: hypothetical protein WCJ94_00745 [bacterium]